MATGHWSKRGAWNSRSRGSTMRRSRCSMAPCCSRLRQRSHGCSPHARWATPSATAAQLLLGPGATAMAERIASTPVPAGGYEANPLASAPELVAEVVSSLDLDPEHAAVYLQLLSLAEPTQRNLVAWNNCTSKQ